MYLSESQKECFEKLKKRDLLDKIASLPTKLPAVYALLIFVGFVFMATAVSVSDSFVSSTEDFLTDVFNNHATVFIACFIGFFLFPYILHAVLKLAVYLVSRFVLNINEKDAVDLAEGVIYSTLKPFTFYGASVNEGFLPSLKEHIDEVYSGCDTRAKSKSGSLASGGYRGRIEGLSTKIMLTDCIRESLYFAYGGNGDYCRIYRSLAKRVVYDRSSNGGGHTHRFYETWYFCELDNTIPCHITIGTSGFVTKKNTELIPLEDTKKKFRITKDNEYSQHFLTENKKAELLALSNMMGKDFCIEIVGNNALLVENRKSAKNFFRIRYKDTEESYTERIQTEIEKMKAIVDYLS